MVLSAISTRVLGRSAAALTTAGIGLGAYRYQNVVEREGQLPTTELDVFASLKPTPAQKQQVLVIGGGVVGVTTAYKLALAGHSVALLEANQQPSEECSACAAGGMQQSNPVVDKDTWIAVLKSLFPLTDSYRFFHISWAETLPDPFFLRWVFTFTKTSLFPDAHQDDKQQEMLKFTGYAVKDMVKLMEKGRMAKPSGYNPKGSVNVSYDDVLPPPTVKEDGTPNSANTNATSSKMSFEPFKQLLSTDEILEVEPSLRFQTKLPKSAKYEYESRSASAERFTKELHRRCVRSHKGKIAFSYDTIIKAIEVQQDSKTNKPRIAQLKTNRGIIQVPDNVKVVVAAGSWTPHILSLMDLYAPVYPLKGYAMSVSASEIKGINRKLREKDLPSRIVSDKYMYTSRLGQDEIRITSIGEFSGWSTKPTPEVDEEFRREAVRQFPQLAPVISKAQTRCGHRPYVSDGILLMGAVDTHDNLFVSCGPGSNGWKLATGSGEIIQRLISGQTDEDIQNELGFSVEAFSPKGRVLKAPLFAKICRAVWDV